MMEAKTEKKKKKHRLRTVKKGERNNKRDNSIGCDNS